MKVTSRPNPFWLRPFKTPSQTCPAVSRSRSFPTATSVIAVRRSPWSCLRCRGPLHSARRIKWQRQDSWPVPRREGNVQSVITPNQVERRCMTMLRVFFFLFFRTNNAQGKLSSVKENEKFACRSKLKAGGNYGHTDTCGKIYHMTAAAKECDSVISIQNMGERRPLEQTESTMPREIPQYRHGFYAVFLSPALPSLGKYVTRNPWWAVTTNHNVISYLFFWKNYGHAHCLCFVIYWNHLQ